MKYRSSQSGSAHALAIILLVVVLLFALGWIFWQNFVLKDADTNQTQTENTTASTDTNTSNNTPASALKTLTIKPTLATSDTSISVPDGWSVTSAGDGIQKKIGATTYAIDFLLAKDAEAGGVTRNYAHFVDDYAAGNNQALKTVKSSDGASLTLVKSVSMNDVVVRTCANMTDKTCYPQHDGTALIVRLSTVSEGAQNYTGIQGGFDTDSTKAAIEDFATIAASL